MSFIRMDGAAFAKWRDAMGLKFVCPACGGVDFGVSGMIGVPIMQDGKVPFEVAPFQPICCNHCGFVMLFLASPAGPPDPGDGGG